MRLWIFPLFFKLYSQQSSIYSNKLGCLLRHSSNILETARQACGIIRYAKIKSTLALLPCVLLVDRSEANYRGQDLFLCRFRPYINIIPHDLFQPFFSQRKSLRVRSTASPFRTFEHSLEETESRLRFAMVC